MDPELDEEEMQAATELRDMVASKIETENDQRLFEHYMRGGTPVPASPQLASPYIRRTASMATTQRHQGGISSDQLVVGAAIVLGCVALYYVGTKLLSTSGPTVASSAAGGPRLTAEEWQTFARSLQS